MRSMLKKMAGIGLAAWLVALALAGPAAAQATEYQAWPVKYVCGHVVGDVPLLSDHHPWPHEYVELKPGNYATLVNFLNLSFEAVTVEVVFMPNDGTPAIYSGPLALAPLQAAHIGCDDIAGFIGFPPGMVGAILEGYVTLGVLGTDEPLRVDAVYTYSSQNAFEEHRLWRWTETGISWVAYAVGLGIFPHVKPPPIGGGATFDIAASGAGGLGLGASIDVERVEPSLVSLPAPMADLAP